VLWVLYGYSLAFGARFLKRVIDDTIKLPISQHWKEGQEFRVIGREGKIVVEPFGKPETEDIPAELVYGA
jgi:ATP-dependent Clp protease ATP-binding subunit ClpA